MILSNRNGDPTFGELLKELSSAVTTLVKNEAFLLKEEIKQTGSRLARDSAKAAAFGALLALSVLPFIAFLVIGLGDLMGGRYWLSSLIVAVVFAAVGGIFAMKAYRDIKDHDLELPHVKHTLEREREMINHTISEVKDATHRRAV